MGCGGSKSDDLPLVIRCRERKAFIKAAADHRYALAAAHVSYFHSLEDVGDALGRLVDQELVIPSPLASPVLTLPSDHRKNKKKENHHHHHKHSSSSTSLSHSGSGSHIHLSEDDGHLHLSSGTDSELDFSANHVHMRYSPEIEIEQPYLPYSPLPPQTNWGPYGLAPNTPEMSWGNPPGMGWGPYGVYPPPQSDFGQFGVNSTRHTYYMKRSTPQIQSVIYDPAESGQGYGSSYSFVNSYPSYENIGIFGFRSQPREPQNHQPGPPTVPPPPPSPKVSGWDFFNPFDMFDSSYSGYYSHSNKYGYGSIASSPDSNEVRKREGIPDLEDETEPETFGAVRRGKKLSEDIRKNSGEGTFMAVPSKERSGEGSSRRVPLHKESSEGSSKTVSSHCRSEGTHRGVHSRGVALENDQVIQSVDVKEVKGSPDTILTNSTENGSVRKKGVTFEVDGGLSTHDAESSKLSSLTAFPAHGTRDIQDVVAEIRDEFAMASSYGKEVAMLLEVGKLPYQSRFTLLKVILSRILCLKAPSLSSSSPPSSDLIKLAVITMKLGKAYYGDSENNSTTKSINLSSTLEKLYAWEKKLYKQVKDEEKLRVIYEKLCKRLKTLDDRGAESSKIDATQASIRKLLTKLNVCIKAIDGVSTSIHRLRDEELQPQVTDLFYGVIRMWKAMLKCHHKQFQAIMESKARSLIANTGSRRDSCLRATVKLEMELLTWSSRFSSWLKSQQSFIQSLNEWLLRCLLHEPEVTPDGIVPFSPGRIGAPPIFVICNDWSQANGSVSETGVTNAMRSFASILRELFEKQDVERKHRLKAEYLSEDFERKLRTLRMENGRLQREGDAMSDKTGVSIVASDSGVSPLDDLKVDLDSMREKLKDERARHEEAIKMVRSAASSSLQAGLIPIFKALGNFTSDAIKAYEHVRIHNVPLQP